MKMKQGIKYDFSLLALLLIPVGVSLSVVGYQLSSLLKLPVFIDLIGTVMVGMIAGPWVGMITGLLGNVVNGTLNPIAIPFGFVAMCVGFSTGYFSKWKMYTNIVGILISGALGAIIAAMSSAVVTVFLFGGVTGSGTDLLTAAFLTTGKQIWEAVFTTNIISGIINTTINMTIALIIIKRIPERFLVKLNYGFPYLSKKSREQEKSRHE
ncbi:energy-coupling factor transport system substrate-specific component [Pilibacter termitis]|uniref:Energy-coupling factor transport system substrate-specific component n=1 Tax=Pilibacter termitis TaxID=263852 RepID=A0A1T4LWV5_9ENTE|nr:ECF transporter S component [Pilibacter termitis]SJZ59229.1 energy-coupling factor transport system substrate-specific component [Pilibacter termitis]